MVARQYPELISFLEVIQTNSAHVVVVRLTEYDDLEFLQL